MKRYIKAIFVLFTLLVALTAYKAKDLSEVLKQKLFAFSQEKVDVLIGMYIPIRTSILWAKPFGSKLT